MSPRRWYGLGKPEVGITTLLKAGGWYLKRYGVARVTWPLSGLRGRISELLGSSHGTLWTSRRWAERSGKQPCSIQTEDILYVKSWLFTLWTGGTVTVLSSLKVIQLSNKHSWPTDIPGFLIHVVPLQLTYSKVYVRVCFNQEIKRKAYFFFKCWAVITEHSRGCLNLLLMMALCSRLLRNIQRFFFSPSRSFELRLGNIHAMFFLILIPLVSWNILIYALGKTLLIRYFGMYLQFWLTWKPGHFLLVRQGIFSDFNSFSFGSRNLIFNEWKAKLFTL